MAYILASDLRQKTAGAFSHDKVISEGEASDALITAQIVTASAFIDSVTNDHFEPLTGVTIEFDSYGGTRLYLPRRTRAVTTVKTRDVTTGTLTTETATNYLLHSSLSATGSVNLDGHSMDWIDVVPGLSLSTGSWPSGPQTVQVVGNFGWAAVPDDIKRLTALLVYDHFKPAVALVSGGTGGGFLERIQTADQTYSFLPTEPQSSGSRTGIPEADGIIARYTYGPSVLVA